MVEVSSIEEKCSTRQNNFDCFRFIAALLVIYSHAFVLIKGDYSGEILAEFTNGVYSAGEFAVGVFLILSGFLITQSYLKSKSLQKYLLARVLRIFPAFIVVIFLMVFVLGPLITNLPLKEYFNHSGTFSYLLNCGLIRMQWELPGVFYGNPSVSVNGSLWTIPYEFLFYLVIVILGILKILKKKNLVLIIYLITLVLEWKKNSWISDSSIFSTTFTIYNLIHLGVYFLTGVVIYLYRKDIILHKICAILAVVALLICWRKSFCSIPFAIFGGYLLMYFGYHSKIRFHNFNKFGDFSYGLYIFAFPIQQSLIFWSGNDMSPYVNFAISSILALGCAFLSWNLIEKRAMQLKNSNITGWRIRKTSK